MATLQSFDAEIEKTRTIVNDMRGKLDAAGDAWVDGRAVV